MTLAAYILIAVSLLALTGVLFFLIFALESVFRGHDLPTSRRATRALADVVKKYQADGETLYDLGCSHGSLSLRLNKLLPQLQIYAVDNSAVRVFFAKLKNIILGRKVKFRRQDIFNIDLRNADIVYTYLWYDLMPRLEEKLQRELRKGALVITNTSHFQDWKLTEKVITHPGADKTPGFETLFVYIKE